MKNIYYSLSFFHKAIKRNKPEKIFYDDRMDYFWFFTHKACLSYSANDLKDVEHLKLWLKNQGVKIEYADSF